MEFDTVHIKGLLKELSEHTGQTFDGVGFMVMSEALQEFREFPETSKRYLSEKLYKRLQKCDTQKVGLMRDKLEKIAQFLNYKNLQDFITKNFSPLDKRLEGCIGNWYSFVRCNSGKPDILISPVRIYAEQQKVYFELKGMRRRFRGELRLKGSCLFCLLDTGTDKEIHLSFKIGMEEKPLVLQGTFSGVSSGGDPIGGREILIRDDELNFEKLINKKMKLNEAATSDELKWRKVAEYFSSYEGNNLKISNVSTFDLDDL